MYMYMYYTHVHASIHLLGDYSIMQQYKQQHMYMYKDYKQMFKKPDPMYRMSLHKQEK